MTEKAKQTTKGSGKDVIYVDADDEITAIIDKVHGSGDKIVALVLPKRASVLQSVVNMKLLKRTADSSKKHVVLITSEASLMPLAGSVGVHVARSLQSKPEVPDAPAKGDDKPEAIEETGDDEAGDVDKSRSVGELAGAAALDAETELDDTIELDDDEDEADGKSAAGAKADKKGVKGKDKKFKIPNFSRFRLVLMLGIIGVFLLGGGVYAALVTMPKAVIRIKTDSSTVNSSTIVTLKTGDGVQVDLEQNTVPATKQEVKKTLTQQVPATGQQNNGAKAAGTIKFYNCNKDDTLSGTDRVIAAGTGVRANNLTYITGEAVTVPPSNFVGNNCLKNKPSTTIAMTAQNGGAAYNQAADTYAVAGFASISGSGSATTGGTDDIIKIVTQADIDNATQKIGAQDTTGIKEQLKTDLGTLDLFPVVETFQNSAPETKTNVAAGAQAESVTVTQTIPYSMLGAKESDLEKIVSSNVKSKIDTKKQTILDYGLNEATFLMQEQKADGAVLNMQTVVVAGPDLDTEEIKKQVAGKKSGDAQGIIKQYPGVTEVNVEYSPFWVGSIPKKTSKITITVEEPQAAAESDDDAQSPASP